MNSKLFDFLRNIYLAIEWRIIATFLTFFAAYIVSKDIKISVEIVSLEVVLKIIAQTFWIKFRVKNSQK